MKLILTGTLAVACFATLNVSAQTLGDTFIDGGLEVKYFVDFHRNQGAAEPLDFDVRLINDAPRNLTLLGDFTLKGGFELGDSMSDRGTPFVDFHYGSGRVEDFNVRLINESDRWLVVQGGNFAVEGMARVTSLELTSDRNAKNDFQSADTRKILTKLSDLPLSTWHYTNSPASRHLGPTAQDFKRAFDLGGSDTQINVVDGIGVALAAIQALAAENEVKERELSLLKSELAEIKAALKNLHGAEFIAQPPARLNENPLAGPAK